MTPPTPNRCFKVLAPPALEWGPNFRASLECIPPNYTRISVYFPESGVGVGGVIQPFLKKKLCGKKLVAAAPPLPRFKV